MDPLSHYGAYAFIPYTTPPPPPDPPAFDIKHTSTYTYCGPLLVPTNLPPSLYAWSYATASPSSALLQRLLPLLTFFYPFFEKAGVRHYWLSVRATRPTREYDVPRWHVDEDFFSPALTLEFMRMEEGEGRKKRKTGRKEKSERGRRSWKVCTTLLGPSTLFLRHSENKAALARLRETKRNEGEKREHVCSSIRCAGCFDTGDAVRQSLATVFKGEEVMQAGYGEVAFFRTGEEEGAVHSEPSCGVDRVFVNVVPGTEEELRKLMGRYGMEFPRAWSLGLPGTMSSTSAMGEPFKTESIGNPA